jgi:hypothetical protein
VSHDRNNCRDPSHGEGCMCGAHPPDYRSQDDYIRSRDLAQRAIERGQIVSWLRGGCGTGDAHAVRSPRSLADDIAKGKHLK